MFLLGIYTGLRISDILRLRVKDVSGSHISIREKKTNKQKRIFMAAELKKELLSYNRKEAIECIFDQKQGRYEPGNHW